MQISEIKKELVFRELARRKLSYFIRYLNPNYRENWHHSLIIHKLEAVERGEIRKLMIFVPPRHGKSEIASINFPAWFFGRNPTKNIIASSYNTELAVSFGRKARNLVADDRYRKLFPKVSLAEDSKAAGMWITNKGGEYIAVGIGGGATGRGAHVFLIDDPIKDKDEAQSKTIQERNIEWYRTVARLRLAPGGAMVVIQTRWHDEDLAGKLLSAEDDWEVISLPAIAECDEEFRKEGEALWPSQYPVAELDEIKGGKIVNGVIVNAGIGIENWSAMYQQNPLNEESQVFRKQMFKYITMEEVLGEYSRCFVSIDPAPAKTESSDFIGVCINWVDRNNYWHIKAFHVKFNAAELINLMFKLYVDYRFECIGIEKGTYKDVIKPFLDEEMRKRNQFFIVKELDHGQRNKELRIRGLTSRYEAGQIYHIQGQSIDLESELLRFPKGKHDDIIDSLSYQSQIAEMADGLSYDPTPTVESYMMQ